MRPRYSTTTLLLLATAGIASCFVKAVVHDKDVKAAGTFHVQVHAVADGGGGDTEWGNSYMCHSLPDGWEVADPTWEMIVGPSAGDVGVGVYTAHESGQMDTLYPSHAPWTCWKLDRKVWMNESTNETLGDLDVTVPGDETPGMYELWWLADASAPFKTKIEVLPPPGVLVNTASTRHTVESGADVDDDTFAVKLEDAPVGPDTLPDLIISEYVEGASFDKAVEIYNGTGEEVALKQYYVGIARGGEIKTDTNIQLPDRSLKHGEVFVLSHSKAAAGLAKIADMTSGSLDYNGDDTVILHNRETGETLDSIGERGSDPGTQWGSGDTLSTLDMVLRRKASVCEGDPVDDDSFGLPQLELDWEGFDKGDFSGIGSHASNCPSVLIDLDTTDASEGTTTPIGLRFTADDFGESQGVRAVGVDDDIADGDIEYGITITPKGAQYNGVPVDDVPAVNHDDDARPGMTLVGEDLVTSESGVDDALSIRLTAPPTDPVTIKYASNDPGEAVPVPAEVVFTSQDWFLPVVVTIEGQDDDVDDGGQEYAISSEATSDDDAYNGIPQRTVQGKNADDDDATIWYHPSKFFSITEGGTQDITVRPLTEPDKGVTLTFEPINGTISQDAVTFDSSDWETTKIVTFTAFDDDIDGSKTTKVVVSINASQSADAPYAKLGKIAVLGEATDNDTAGVSVDTKLVALAEGGSSMEYTVTLDSEPTTLVFVEAHSSDSDVATVPTTDFELGTDNWAEGVKIAVTPVDDDIIDGEGQATISHTAQSKDDKYHDIKIAGIRVTVDDDDVATITPTPSTGLFTSEAGGTDTFKVTLGSQPADIVKVLVGRTGPISLDVKAVELHSRNWDTGVEVTVTGKDDLIDAGDQAWTVTLAAATSTDSNYDGIDPMDVTGTNTDDDIAALVLDDLDGVLSVTEQGSDETFTVKLATEPIADVTVALSSDDPSEAVPSVSSLTFTSSNWDTAQTVTVQPQNDAIDDGPQTFFIELDPSGTDAAYEALATVKVEGATADDADATAVNFGPSVPVGGLDVTEGGATATFDVSLDSEPLFDVVINLQGTPASESVMVPAILTFTAADWYTPQTVTVAATDDAIDDGDTVVAIAIGSITTTDPTYSVYDTSSLGFDVNVTDNDTAGLALSLPIELNTSEGGDSILLGPVLTTEPMDNVTVSVVSADTTEGIVEPAVLTFTPANWDTQQLITVTGVDDDEVDDNIAYDVTVSITSADAVYEALADVTFTVVNADDDDETDTGEEEGDCGCATGTSTAGGWGLILLGMATLRRRRRA